MIIICCNDSDWEYFCKRVVFWSIFIGRIQYTMIMLRTTVLFDLTRKVAIFYLASEPARQCHSNRFGPSRSTEIVRNRSASGKLGCLRKLPSDSLHLFSRDFFFIYKKIFHMLYLITKAE